MLKQTHGRKYDVGERMYLVRMHADRAEHECVPRADLRVEAKQLLDADRACAPRGCWTCTAAHGQWLPTTRANRH